MAYSPIERGRVLGSPVLRDIAARHDATSAQVALACVRDWTTSARFRGQAPRHVEENAAVPEVVLGHDDFVGLDAEFPPPPHAEPLEML
jgi:diketogulonate reductase-like aldo/keto reductase